MDKSLKFIIGIFLLLLISTVVIASTSFNTFVPAVFTTLTSTAVNFTINFSQNNNDETVFNVTIYNSSDPSSSRAYSILSPAGNISINGTLLPVTFSVTDLVRTWYFINITNGSSTAGAVLSDVRIFDTDTGFLKFQFGGYGAFNITVDKGLIAVASNITAEGLRLRNKSEALIGACSANNVGMITFNGTSTTTKFLGCDGTNWVALG